MENRKERRSFKDRRTFTYTAHVPERRSGRDRRSVNAENSRSAVA
jgi:hypothetical protein